MGCQCIMLIQENTNANNIVYAGFFVRLAAYLVDIIIVALALSFFKLPMWIVSLLNPDIPLLQPILFKFSLWDIILYLVGASYFILMTYLKGFTVGKYLLRLKVVSSVTNGKLSLINIIYRETIGRYLSGIFYIGYLIIGASDNKRALHDRLCETLVTYNC